MYQVWWLMPAQMMSTSSVLQPEGLRDQRVAADDAVAQADHAARRPYFVHAHVFMAMGLE